MRTRMDEQLAELNKQLIEMGAMCEEAINQTVLALTTGNMTHAENAVNIDKRIDEKEREIEDLALKFMLRQQPVAKDLRQVSSALKIITDMERIGDQARDIAEITQYITTRNPAHMQTLMKMAEATTKMVNEAIDAFVQQDLELARAVVAYDDVVDNYFLEIKEELVSMIHTDGTLAEHGLDLLMIAKYFERIGDHATNIAEWVEFSITGIHGGSE